MPLLPSPVPHPLSYFDAPGWLRDALEWVVGVDWPEGDEKAMRYLADEWYAAARQVGPLLDEADQAALTAIAAFGGPESHEAQALLRLWQQLGGGPEAALTVVTELFDDVGALVDAGANEIEGVKLEFYIELALLLIELVILAATAVLTFGGSLAGAGPVMLATRFAIQQILKRATKELLQRALKKDLRDRLKSRITRFAFSSAKEGLEEGLQELATSAGTQAYQIQEGNRAGFDTRDLALSFGLGTLGGAVANVASIGGTKAVSMRGRFGEHALRGMGGEILAEVSIGVVTGQGVSWTSLGMAATSGASGTVIGDSQRLVDGQLPHNVKLEHPAFSPWSANDATAPVTREGGDEISGIVHTGVLSNASPTLASTPSLSTTSGAMHAIGDPASAATSIGLPTASHTMGSGGPGTAPITLPASGSAVGGLPSMTGPSPVSGASTPSMLAGGPAPANAPNATGTATPTGTPHAGAAPGIATPTGAPPAGQVAPALALRQAPSPAGLAEQTAMPAPWLVPTPPTRPIPVEAQPGTPKMLVEDAIERQAYAEHVLGGIQTALRNRLLRLVDTLEAECEWPERRKQLREQGILALTEADLEPIAHELWRIANADTLDGRLRLAFGGLDDDALVSQATGSDVPPPVERTRRYGEPGGYRQPLALHQQDVEAAVPRDEHGVPQRFGDLNGDWLRLVNDGGPAADPSRAINCTDVVLSVLDTWLHGRPRVAAPRTIDRFTLDDAMRPLGGELNGAQRVEQATGGRFQRLLPDRRGFARLEQALLIEGHGACAVLVQEWPNGEAHATTVHNQHGQILYVDAQRPDMPVMTAPPLGAKRMDALALSPSATSVDLGTPPGDWSTLDPEGAPIARSGPQVEPMRMFRDPTDEELLALGVGTATAADLGLTDADLNPAQLAQLAHVATVDPRLLGFTQRSVSAATSDGVAAADLEAKFRDGGWRGGPVHAVLWGDGSLASLDHRRLRAAVRAGLPLVPVVVHKPSDPISAWGESGEKLADDLRELPDGSWVVGGDEGRNVYPKGTRPQTCGEAALFRAAEQRSLLPGHLFGTRQEPVTLGKPPGQEVTPTLPDDVAALLHELRAKAEAAADAVQTDLEALGHPLHGLESRIKSYDSLARKYDHEDDRLGGAPLQNDVLRFTVVLPEGAAYTSSLQSGLATLTEGGHEVVGVKNFWAPGNRFYSVNATLRSPTGQLFEVQFSTPTSQRANALTHEPYEVFRRRDELVPRRIHALMHMLALNRQLKLPLTIPAGLADLYPPVDGGLAKWINQNPSLWDEYLTWLQANGRTLDDVVAEFKLTAADFPMSARRASAMREGDRGILRALSK